MTLKIIAGRFRNRLLKSPKGTQTRPTSALLRKSVFDISQMFIENSRFLDLFAGSGAMGIEALSRGAKHATFVDKDKNALRAIEENIHLLQIEKECTVLAGEAFIILKRLKEKKEQFDLIYIDPPYVKEDKKGSSLYEKILHFLEENDLIANGAKVFVEEGHPSILNPQSLALKHLKFKDTRRFGISVLHQFYTNYHD